MGYNVFRVKKKKGWRVVMDPSPELRLMLDIIKVELDKIPLHDAAHGFVVGRSCVTNARPHRQKQFVLNLDIKDFFSSINLGKILDCLKDDNLPEWVRHWLPICFAPAKYQSEMILATGASTSPVLSNLYMRELDSFFSDCAESENLTYTRYADDMTFSGDIQEKGRHIIKTIGEWLMEFGLTLNRRKTKLMPYYQKQVVTGILVNNEKLSLPRKYKERIFAEVRGKTFESLTPQLAGSVEYIRSVDPSFYMKLLKEIEKNGEARLY